MQLSEGLHARLDSYRAREGRSRSEVIRTAIEDYLAEDRAAEIDRRIVDAYSRHPADTAWSDDAARRMVAAEPW